MIFYDYFRSSACFRVRIALRLKGVEVERRLVHLLKGEQHSEAYKAVNPQGLVPTLQLEDGTRLTQSLAIIEFLDTQSPQNPLIPTDPVAAAQVRKQALVTACDIHPLNNVRVLNHLRQQFGQDDEGVHHWYRHWIAEGFQALEALLEQDAGTFCYGDQLSLADVFLVPQVVNAQRFSCPLEDFPLIRKHFAHLSAHPDFAASFPQQQPEFEG